ncbi:phage holin family protein [Enterococcus gallinarum]|uniref:Holin n=1 Tax=Siphoviridae sp. ct1is2 TaxID=2826273 RepID=A0A8S5NP61_9CAUD|nr:phage holin family protein [Enterococcus gallinarum]MEB6065007.1 phage holin family protein [Enterococcus gallinarum]DAD95835.1 MAG TPA: holin [Siphoviridae sp. ct1is2]
MVIINNGMLLNEFRGLLTNGYIQLFLWVVVGDIVTGLCKGIFVKEANSTKGLLGIVKHMLVVCLVIIAYPYLKIMNLETFATAFVFFYIAVYGISITENLGQLGVPIPNWVKERLSKLQDTNTNPNDKSTSSEKDYGDGQEFTEKKE